MGPGTTATLLPYWASRRPDHTALRWGGGELTYRELDERSNKVAQALAASGVAAGDHVAYLDKNSPEQLELLFGAAKLNAVPCPVNYRLAPPEVAFIVNDSQAKLFVVGHEFVPVLDKVRSGIAADVVVTGTQYDEWRDAHDAIDPNASQSMRDICYLMYSSGTTGRPKGVQLTQANLIADLEFYPEVLAFGRDAVNLVAAPLYHISGGGWALLGFFKGATNVLVREIVPSRLADVMVNERVTHALLVPAVLQVLLQEPGIETRDFSALKAILYGASPISETVLRGALRTFGCRFVQGYGLTETTGIVLYLPAADHALDSPNLHRLRSVGVPITDTEVKVVDPVTGETVQPGVVGEIWIKGPTVMLGYWNMPDQTAATITADGWLRSGDAGYQDEDGYIYIYDRIKDMVVSGGENIYPAEVENVIMSHPDVLDVAVIGIPSDRWGETPLAIVVPRPGTSLSEAALLHHCRSYLAGYKCPTDVSWVNELPRNPSGKVLKKELRAPYWEGRDRNVN